MNEGHKATRSFYDRISSAYDVIADAGEHVCRERGLEALDVQPGERVLEIGYGTGHTLVALAQAVGDSGRVFGIDISEGMRRVATERVDAAGLNGRVELGVAAAPPLPYPDAGLDAVTLSFTLELLPLDVIPVLLAETRRVLRPGGRLAIVAMAEPAPGTKESPLTHTYKWLHRHFPHIVDCQPIAVEQFVRDAGFEVQQNIQMQIWTLPVVALVAVPAPDNSSAFSDRSRGPTKELQYPASTRRRIGSKLSRRLFQLRVQTSSQQFEPRLMQGAKHSSGRYPSASAQPTTEPTWRHT